MSELAYKPNWDETKEHFRAWWKRDGLVLSGWCGAPSNGELLEHVPAPPAKHTVEDDLTTPELRAHLEHYALVQRTYPADIMPLASSDIGPGSLALYVGGEPGFSNETVWFEPIWKNIENPEELPPIKFDPNNKWWKITEGTLKAHIARGKGKYLAGCPDLVENIDILSALRDPQTFMMDLILRPDWVKQKVSELNQAFFDAFDHVYEIIRDEEGGNAFQAFALWGPGKTAKVQCDAAAMISPDMFREFVAPGLKEQCAWLDYSMYHLDGTQAMCHLDALLEIDELDAIEWTPQAGIENGGNPRWYPLYEKILNAGKSVQAIGVGPDEVIPLLDAVGGKGMYILTRFDDPAHADKLLQGVEAYR